MKLIKIFSSVLFCVSVCKGDVGLHGLRANDMNLADGLRGMNNTETNMISDTVAGGRCNSVTPCANGACCSRYYWCGGGAAWCSKDQGCRSNCWNEPSAGPTPSPSSEPSAGPTPAPSPAPTLPAGKCSASIPCADGTCCSRRNNCGTGFRYCSRWAGCKSNCPSESSIEHDPQMNIKSSIV